jgi:signal transduction histidine kinase
MTVQVQDEGVGIESEDLERVFDPFVTKREGGTGLGLPIAYQIVSQHEGHIEARRNAERGMTFTISLPLVQDQSQVDSELLRRQV